MRPETKAKARRWTAAVGRFIGVVALASAASAGQSAYNFEFTSIDGTPLPFEEFRGKAVMVVNTASQCGFTGQYAGLQQLYDTYKARGFVVLGVPSNDFGGQEPGSEAEIKAFCAGNFDVTFPMTAKYAVTGDNAHPFYRWASAELGGVAKPRWNFHKYLIAPDGRIVDWFSTVTAPSSSRVTSAIEKILPVKQ
jgi:glutathione peroxidase